MRILFQGLVCHTTIEVGGKKQRIAVLPVGDDPGTGAKHKATLSYRKSDVVGSTGTSGHTCNDLDGCVDTNVGRGEAAMLDIGDVPQLTKTTTGTVASGELVECPPDATMIRSIFFLPPGGRLSRDFYFNFEVMFNGIVHGPMPEIVIYAFSSATNVKFNLGSSTVELKPSAEVIIANVCKTAGKHYQFYRNIFNTPDTITVYDPTETTSPCSFATRPPALPACAGGSTLNIDCVNSQFP